MATVIECGSKPNAWQPNGVPSRPKPQITSSPIDVDVVLRADRQHLVEIGRRRHDHAARPHHRLDEERRDRVRPLLLDQLVELGGEPRREILLALAVVREAIVMRAAGVQDAGDRHVEIGLVDRQRR